MTTEGKPMFIGEDLKLYQYPRAIDDAFLNNTDPETGEIFDTLQDELNALSWGFEDKATGCIHAHLHYLAEAKKCKDEIARVKKMKDALENRAEGVRQYLEMCMLGMQKTEVGDTIHKAKFKKLPPVVIVHDMAGLPDEFKRFKPIPDPEPDKKKIKDAWKAGALEVGPEVVEVLEGRQSLAIK